MANEKFRFPDEEGDTSELDTEIETGKDDAKPQDDDKRSDMEPTDEELNDYGHRVQRRMKKFSEGYHEEKRAREAAEQERLTAEEFAKAVYEENKRLKEQLKTGSEAFIESTKSVAETELESAKKSLKEAFEAGDADKLVAAQEAISKATVKIDRASTMRPVEIEDNFRPPERTQPTQEMTPRTQRWVSDNSDWFGKDDEMTMLAVGLDKKLQREYGANYIGTEEYFRTIDGAMRKRFPEYFDTQSDEDDRPSQTRSNPADVESPRRARSASPVAPASRSAPPNRIRLKDTQIALARKLGITTEQYAKQVAILKRGE
jgi:hypothetical protein